MTEGICPRSRGSALCYKVIGVTFLTGRGLFYFTSHIKIPADLFLLCIYVTGFASLRLQDKPHGPNWEEMQELFFKDANIPDERIHTTTMENWETYDQEIRDAGGIDVMLIGLGWDGHFCSNCPRCTPMDSYTYPMDRKTKNAANPTYPARDHLPITLSMGPKSLMRVKHLVMIVTGKEKA